MNRVRVLIAHADGEAAVAARLAAPLRQAGYEVVDHASILVGESLHEEASKLLAAGWPIVVCGTVKALGTGWVHRVVNAARQHPATCVLPVRMEQHVYLEALSWDLKIAEYWQDPTLAVRELCAALSKRYPAGPSPDAANRTAEARYRSVLLGECDLLNLSGLPDRDRHLATRQLALRRLYLPLRVESKGGGDAPLEPHVFDALEEERAERRGTWREGGPARRQATLDRVAVGERLAAARRLVVLGEPGSGKSTLVRWLVTAYLLRSTDRAAWSKLPDVGTLPDEDWLPLLVRCRDLGHAPPGAIEELIEASLRALALTRDEREGIAGALVSRLRDGTALLLVDGLDEINDRQSRAAFCAQLERVHLSFPRSPVVVTSRTFGYREMGTEIGRGFEHAVIVDLAPEDKDDFARRWCELTEPPSQRKAAAEALSRDIHSLDQIERLTGNPMLLTTMALIRRSLGRLPNRRGQLYKEAVRVLLNWRPEIGEPLDQFEALPQLEYIAYAMCERQVQQLGFDDLVDLCVDMRKAYPNVRAVHRHDPEAFIRLVEQRTGLLTEVGQTLYDGQLEPVYEFRHLTFQEYLAGVALIRGHYPGRRRDRSLAAAVETLAAPVECPERPGGGRRRLVVAEGWREPIRLCVASCLSSEVDDLVVSVLQPAGGEDEALTARPRAVLAAQCLADEPDASDHVADRVIAALVEHLWDEEDAWSEVADAVVELGGSRWREPLLAHLAAQFLELSSLDRAAFPDSIDRVIAAIAGQGDQPHEVMKAQLSPLTGGDPAAAMLAALTVGGLEQDELDPPSAVVEALINLLVTNGPVSDAAALALRRLHRSWPDELEEQGGRGRGGSSWSSRWQPSLAQSRLLTDVLHEQPRLPDGARISLYQLAGHTGIEAVIPLARATLTSSPSELRAWSVWALGSLHDLESVPRFVVGLRDPNHRVRAAAARAVGWCRDRGAFDALVGALADPVVEVRAAACLALGQIRHPDAVAALIGRTVDGQPVVRAAAAAALGELGDESAAWPVASLLDDAYLDVRASAARALREVGGVEHVESLIGLLDDSSEARRAAGESICELAGPAHLPQLLALLDDGDRRVQGSAVYAVRRVGGEVAVTALLALLDRDGGVSTAAVCALVRMIAPEDPEVRAALLSAAAVGGTMAVDAVARWLTTHDRSLLGELAVVVRNASAAWPWPIYAVASSGAVHHPAVLAAARERSEDDDLSVRIGAAMIRCAAGAPGSSASLMSLLSQLGARGHRLVADVFAEIDAPPQETISVLLALASSDHPSTRAATARALSRLDLPEATDALLRLLDDPISWVRHAAVSGLRDAEKLENPAVTKALLDRAADRCWDVRVEAVAVLVEAVAVLGELPRSVTVDVLLNALANDPSGEVRRAVPEALAKHRGDDVALALGSAARNDPDPLVRDAAGRALDQRAP